MTNPASTRCTEYSNPTGFSFILAHEFGHSQLKLLDEYVKGGAFCGHSIMNGPSNSRVLCTPQTHCTDPTLDGSGNPIPPKPGHCDAGMDAWTTFKALGTVPYAPDFDAIGLTPDEWDSLRGNTQFLKSVRVTP